MKININDYQTQIIIGEKPEGQSIEEKVRRLVDSNEPIDAEAPLIYTERKDGVLAEYDPRTDRWDIAQSAMDRIAKSHRANRLRKMEAEEHKGETQEPPQVKEPDTKTE